MTKSEFLNKYPELNENGEISDMKLCLLISYHDNNTFIKDDKIKNLLHDYHTMIKCEKRQEKIEFLLYETALNNLLNQLIN